MTSDEGLRLALRVLGGTAVVMGAAGVLTGVRGVLDNRTVEPEPAAAAPAAPPSPTVDSELRFFAAWYAVMGVVMLRASRRPDAEGATIALVAAGWLTAASGRVLSLRSTGRPHPLALTLMAVEFLVGALLVPWQQLVRRRVRAATG